MILLEVLMAGTVFGVAVVGLALLFGLAQTSVVAQGDERVALYLARQKLEQLSGLGFGCVPVGEGTSADPDFDADGTGPCPTQSYYQTGITAGVSGSQTFTRVTTVHCVTADYSTTVDPCPTPPIAKRITVTVTPTIQQAVPVTLHTAMTLH